MKRRFPLQKLKAALDEALATFVRISSNVAPMFEMLLLAVVVGPAGQSDGPPSLARADLTFQLNEIEVRKSSFFHWALPHTFDQKGYG